MTAVVRTLRKAAYDLRLIIRDLVIVFNSKSGRRYIFIIIGKEFLTGHVPVHHLAAVERCRIYLSEQCVCLMIVSRSSQQMRFLYHGIMSKSLFTYLVCQLQLIVQCILCLVKLISYIFII